MNPKINKVAADVERTRAKITELQELLPELERKLLDMENAEIVRLVRSADITLAEFPDFVKAMKSAKEVDITAATESTEDAPMADTPSEDISGNNELHNEERLAGSSDFNEIEEDSDDDAGYGDEYGDDTEEQEDDEDV